MVCLLCERLQRSIQAIQIVCSPSSQILALESLAFNLGPMGLEGIAKVAIAVYKVGFEESDGYGFGKMAKLALEFDKSVCKFSPCGVITLGELAGTAPQEEKSDKNDIATGDDIEKPTRKKMVMPVKHSKKENEAKNGITNRPTKVEKEETVEAPSSQHVEYYLKHSINEKLIKGLVDSHRVNDSLSGA
ncbi:hypothetical protein Tco_0938308 [Tanacetum coccineum]|uniref:Uncharacterized protein n=1 Tax=Tanacetum coccineum TaxID=301880 RepID=A0ABQ5DJH6_9ASTR